MASNLLLWVCCMPEWVGQWGYRRDDQLVWGDHNLYLKLKIGDLFITCSVGRDEPRKSTELQFATITRNPPNEYRTRPGITISGEQWEPKAAGLRYWPEPEHEVLIRAFIITIYDSETKTVAPLIDYLKDNAHPVVRALLECALTQEKL